MVNNHGDEHNTNTQTAFAVIAGCAAIFVALVVLVFYFMRDKTMTQEILDVQRRFDAFKMELHAEQQKKMFKYSKGIQEFLKQYKKPILQSAFDLQSRLTNQVKNNFLYSFLQERGGERDKNYALYNFSFVFAEFLGWLEVIRQEMVFVTGDDDTPLLASLIDGIKFQLTGETPVQGTPPPGQADNPEFEKHSKIFQLYAGELRSIGSVMINTDTEGNKSILNADEFQRLMTVKAPPETGNDAANIDWARSRERLFQDMMLPLFDHLRHMARLPKGEAPIRRLAIFQVLLCKLIDLMDNAIPWDSGPKYDPGEEVQYITRDFRLTPLVAYLNSFQRNWMANQMFTETADKMVADELWYDYMEGRDPVWRKLCFCGFREDLAHLPQDERDKKPGMWPGACPPKLCRKRQATIDQHRASAAPERRSTSLFPSILRARSGKEPRDDERKDGGGGGGGGGAGGGDNSGTPTRGSAPTIGRRNPSMVQRVAAGAAVATSGKLTPPADSVVPSTTTASLKEKESSGGKSGGLEGRPSKQDSGDLLAKQPSKATPTAMPPLPPALANGKLGAPPQTPTSSESDSLNNSTPSSTQIQQHPRPGGPPEAGPDFRAITINQQQQQQGSIPPHLPPTLHPHVHAHVRSSARGGPHHPTQHPAASPFAPGAPLAAAATPFATLFGQPQPGDSSPLSQTTMHPSGPAPPSTPSLGPRNPAGGTLLAGTGVASAAALQRPDPAPPRPIHPLQAAALAHLERQRQQEQSEQQQQLQPPPSIQLPHMGPSSHHTSTSPSRVPAMRKWGTHNKGIGIGGPGIGSNRVSPITSPPRASPSPPPGREPGL